MPRYLPGGSDENPSLFGVTAEIRTAHFPNGRQKRYRLNRLLFLYMRSTVPHCSSSVKIACCHLTYSYPLDATNCVVRLCCFSSHHCDNTVMCSSRTRSFANWLASCANYCLWRWIVRTHGHTGFAGKRVSERTQVTSFLTVEECTCKMIVPSWNLRHRLPRRLAGRVVSLHILNRLKPSGFFTYHQV
jgi:hypothetical protein